MAVVLDDASPSHFHSLHYRAEAQLADSPYMPLRRLGISVTGQVVTLSGIVPTFHHKQLAFSTVRGLGDFVEIVDNIQVS